MMLRVSLAAVLLFGGSLTAALAADGPEPAPAPVDAAAALATDLPRFEPSEAGLSVPAIQTLPDTIDETGEDLGSGMASWYGAEFAGRRTASGERFDPGEYTAAHRTLPFGSKVRVTRGQRSVIVRINDRGPFHGSRVIDLSRAAADQLGLVSAGKGRVELALLD